MELGTPIRERLEELVALAQTYRGWSLRRLAAELHRDPQSVVPESGVPKIDLVRGLALALDWSIEDVVRDIYDEAPRPLERDADGTSAGKSFDELDRAAYDAFQRGVYTGMVDLARRAFGVATTGDQRARACIREYGGWDGQGRFQQAMEAAQSGLRESNVSAANELSLRVNLANSHYVLGNFYEGEAMGSAVIELSNSPTLPLTVIGTRGFAFYVRGNCHRAMAGAKPDRRDYHARRAIEDLANASRIMMSESARLDATSLSGIANICEGGILEMKAMIGEVSIDVAMERFMASLDRVLDPSTETRGMWLESFGWWCIFGSNVALRHVTNAAQAEQLVAIFTNKADEIADRLGNWMLREQVWTLEMARRTRILDAERSETGTGTPAGREPHQDQEWILDIDDAKKVAGTMARFPVFRETGWQVLRSSRIIKG